MWAVHPGNQALMEPQLLQFTVMILRFWGDSGKSPENILAAVTGWQHWGVETGKLGRQALELKEKLLGCILPPRGP